MTADPIRAAVAGIPAADGPDAAAALKTLTDALAAAGVTLDADDQQVAAQLAADPQAASVVASWVQAASQGGGST